MRRYKGELKAVQNIITGNTIGIIMPCRYEETNDLDN